MFLWSCQEQKLLGRIVHVWRRISMVKSRRRNTNLTSKENIVSKSYDETTVSNASELIIKDEYARLVPPISEQEYESIRQSMEDNGQWVPIIVNAQRIILDWHTRFRVLSLCNICAKKFVGDRLRTNRGDW